VNEKRVSILTGIFLIFLTILLFRSFFLSLEGGSSSVIPNKYLSLYSTRGIIYDSNGIPLVSNSHKFFYYFDTGYYKKVLAEGKVKPEIMFEQISKYFDFTSDNYDEKSEDSAFILLGISETEKYNLPYPLSLFVAIDHRNERNLLYSSFSEIIGKVDSFGSGINGIEAQFDKELSPKKTGKLEYQSLGKYSRLGDEQNLDQPQNGEDVKISVDLNMQNFLKQCTEEGKEKYNAKSVQGIILESKTGKVKASYSTLGWNAPVMGIYEPGSAIKPFTFALSHKYGLLREDWIFNCKGKIKPYPEYDIVIGDTHVHGEVDLNSAMSKSCNVATIEIALDFFEKMDEWTFYQGFLDLGFGNKSGIEFPKEVSGIVHSPNNWNLITGVQMSFGHGMAVTALQLAAAFNVFATGGIYIPPTLLDTRKDNRKERVVFTNETVERINKMLVETVEIGTGKAARISGLKIAGKTGTAEIAYPGEGYIDGKYNSSFVAFFPAEDPVYTIVLTVEEPDGEIYYGGDVAAPIFKNVVEKMIKYLEKPNKKDPDPIVLKGWKFPDLKGFTRKDVLDIVKVLELDEDNVKLIGDGVVVEQSPKAGTSIYDIKDILIKFEPRGETD